jgi:hypothetical protein
MSKKSLVVDFASCDSLGSYLQVQIWLLLNVDGLSSFNQKPIQILEYLHTAAAAEYLGVAQNTLRKWAARGDIPMHRNPTFATNRCTRICTAMFGY